MRVKVVVEDDGTDVLNQYIIFCKVVDEQSRLKGRTKEALLEAIRICKDRNILRGYLAKHEKEAVDIIMDLYDQDKITERLLRSERAEGEARGRADVARETAVNLHAMDIAVDMITKSCRSQCSTSQRVACRTAGLKQNNPKTNPPSYNPICVNAA